jgi:cellobiose-specific phosphotransferase system component IIA
MKKFGCSQEKFLTKAIQNKKLAASLLLIHASHHKNVFRKQETFSTLLSGGRIRSTPFPSHSNFIFDGL